MKLITRLNVFKKDYKRMAKRGKKMEKLHTVIKTLAEAGTLGPKYHDHRLVGKFRSRKECHIEPDWLLIYRIEKDELILERTGSHSDLFE